MHIFSCNFLAPGCCHHHTLAYKLQGIFVVILKDDIMFHLPLRFTWVSFHRTKLIRSTCMISCNVFQVYISFPKKITNLTFALLFKFTNNNKICRLETSNEIKKTRLSFFHFSFYFRVMHFLTKNLIQFCKLIFLLFYSYFFKLVYFFFKKIIKSKDFLSYVRLLLWNNTFCLTVVV